MMRRLSRWLWISILLVGTHAGKAGSAPSRAVGPIVLLLAPGLRLDDLDDPRLPRLRALAVRSDVALMNVTLPGFATDLASACRTLGAGRRARGATYPSPQPPPRNGEGERKASGGDLGTILRHAGRRVGLVHASHRCGGGELLLALGDTAAAVDVVVAGPGLLVRAPRRPYGVAADVAAAAGATIRLLDTCHLIGVDLGDLERARRYADLCLPERAAAHRTAALIDLDALIGRLAPAVRGRGGGLVLVSPVGDTRSTRGFGLLLIDRAGQRAGLLRSPSTRLDGLVTNTDVAPSLLAMLGVDPGGREFTGRPVRRTGRGGLSDLREMRRAAERAERLRGPALAVLRIALLVAALLAGSGRLGACGAGRLAMGVGLLAVGTMLLGDAVARPPAGLGVLHVACIVAVVVGFAVAGERRTMGTAVLLSCGAVWALLMADVWAGAHVARHSPLGYSLALGARYYGIGNELAGLLLGATLLLPFAAWERWPDRQRGAQCAGIGLYALTLAVVAHPSLGANFGVGLAAAVAFTSGGLALLGRRLGRREAVVIVVVAALLIAAVVARDATRPIGEQTHVGRLVSVASGQGIAPILSMVAGKAITAARVSLSLWGVLVLLQGGVGIGLLRSAAPSPLRTGLRQLIVAAAAIWVFNDSGVIGAALLLAILPSTAAALPGDDTLPRRGGHTDRAARVD